ncbi:hypothetical protein AAHC03_024418 [Spirometra sp. Aus1]
MQEMCDLVKTRSLKQSTSLLWGYEYVGTFMPHQSLRSTSSPDGRQIGEEDVMPTFLKPSPGQTASLSIRRHQKLTAVVWYAMSASGNHLQFLSCQVDKIQHIQQLSMASQYARLFVGRSRILQKETGPDNEQNLDLFGASDLRKFLPRLA